jgi:DNA polymerase-4
MLARTPGLERLRASAAVPVFRGWPGQALDARFGAVFRVILHFDMDAFYASVEQRDQPELRGRPVIVGSPPTQRGVVCAASYEARRFGVRSAMPSVTAGRLCPDGVFLRPRMAAYQAESREIMAIVQGFAGDRVQQVSIDEAYLDISEACQGEDADGSLEKALPVARSIKEAVRVAARVDDERRSGGEQAARETGE